MIKTVYLLRPLTAKAQQWLNDNVQTEPYQHIGTGIGIEHRYIGPIVEAMLGAGLLSREQTEIEAEHYGAKPDFEVL